VEGIEISTVFDNLWKTILYVQQYHSDKTDGTMFTAFVENPLTNRFF